MNPQPKAIDFANWTTQVRKGLLELCIVNLLARGELYGYDLVKRLADVKGLLVAEGTVYPLLSRLRKAGLLKTRLEESPSGPARKYYSLTRQGHRDRTRLNAYWNELNRGVSELLDEREGNHA
ncbi:MAG: PadR family transcriptional regulator [Candidatus Hydrogenedentes bacterium]|nr:PadR family transcriptional regulator [Candidatus Hydrogenedentota bacterium]